MMNYHWRALNKKEKNTGHITIIIIRHYMLGQYYTENVPKNYY